jgi:hypothetical protein
MSDVQIRLEECFDGPSTGINANRYGTENSCDGNSVSGFGDIDEFIVETD